MIRFKVALGACYVSHRTEWYGDKNMVKDGNWRRRHAIQIVAQLPEGIDDALEVLELARELVRGFLSEDQALEPSEVIAFQPRLVPSEA